MSCHNKWINDITIRARSHEAKAKKIKEQAKEIKGKNFKHQRKSSLLLRCEWALNAYVCVNIFLTNRTSIGPLFPVSECISVFNDAVGVQWCGLCGGEWVSDLVHEPQRRPLRQLLRVRVRKLRQRHDDPARQTKVLSVLRHLRQKLRRSQKGKKALWCIYIDLLAMVMPKMGNFPTLRAPLH